MRILEYLRRPGQADHGALVVTEVRDDQTIGRRDRTHDASTTELFGASERGFDICDADIEDRMVSEGRFAAYSSADSGTVAGLDQVQEAVLAGIGHRTGDGRRCCEAPAEQSAVVLAKPLGIGADDLEVHYWISHESPSATVMSQLPRPLIDRHGVRDWP